jgi:ribosomal protein S18 acetylase RimI-like enzyme
MRTAVESAGQSDVPALLDLMNQFYAESDYDLDRSWAEESFRQILRNEARGAVWVAREGAEAIGYIVLTLRHSMEFGGLVGIVDDLFVRASFRRKGVGSALVAALLEASRNLGLFAVHVEVGSNNLAAGALYKAFGLNSNSDGRETLTARLDREVHAV